jgi:hypothetical protein
MKAKLADYLGKHDGETAWIFGKGPSLDKFDFKEAGNLRLVINDVVSRVPEATYCFANDPVTNWIDLYQPDHVLFYPTGHRNNDINLYDAAMPDCHLVPYDDKYPDEIELVRKPQEMAQCLKVLPGTLGSVVQIAYVMGIRKVVAVGIDGGSSHASGQWRTRLRASHATDYNKIRNAFIDACEQLGIELEFFKPNRKAEEMRNGKISVKVLRGTSASGRSLSVGEIVELNPQDAEILIGAGKAIPYREQVIERAVIETRAPAAKKATRKKASK